MYIVLCMSVLVRYVGRTSYNNELRFRRTTSHSTFHYPKSGKQWALSTEGRSNHRIPRKPILAIPGDGLDPKRVALRPTIVVSVA